MTDYAPLEMYRRGEGLGLWPHKGKVVAVGIGHAPTLRRWDGQPETSIGAFAIQALRLVIEDAGVNTDAVDGLVMDPETTTGAWWPEGQEIPADVQAAFNPGVSPLDGIATLSAEWILNNMPELTNVNFTMYGPVCMSNAIVVAAEAVAQSPR